MAPSPSHRLYLPLGRRNTPSLTEPLVPGGPLTSLLGTRDCQGYVEPCEFGEGDGHYDKIDELSFGLMFHGFDYPDETGNNELHSRFWHAILRKGVLEFPRPEECEIRRFVRKMIPKGFSLGENVLPVEQEEVLL
jgi:CRISPR-associated protein Cas5d